MGVKTESIRGEGFNVRYFKFGNGKRVFVIIPGISVKSVMDMGDLVAAQYADMADEFTIYVLDRPVELADGVTLFDIAEETAKAISALNLKNAVLFGASQGGMISMIIALTHPELVQMLVLGSTSAKVDEGQYKVIGEWSRLAREKSGRKLYLAFGRKIYPQAVFEAYKDILAQTGETVTDEEYARFIKLAESSKDFDIIERLSEITCPVLVLGAKDDPVLGGDSSPQIYEALKKTVLCELYMYDGYGHAAFDTAPDYRKRIVDFVHKWDGETVYNGAATPYLSFRALDDTGLADAIFSTRLGGVSEDFLSSLNLGYGRGESDENVTENFKRIADSAGFDYRRIVTSQQTHTTNIRVVTEEDAGKGIVCPREYTDIDGLITNVPDLVLTTFYADCVPLYFLDPVHKAIGLIHSGWRGTVGKIGANAVKLMKENYDSNPADMIACIGPSICKDCYEISSDVAEEFKKAFPAKVWDMMLTAKEGGKFRLDLWEACRQGMLEAGLKEENIHISGICTCCNTDLLYSHRGMNGRRGSLAAFMRLKG